MEDGQSNKKIVAIIQARLGSNRLPGKVLLPFPIDDINSTLLGVIVRALKSSQHVSNIFLATSKASVNDDLEIFANNENINCFRGSEDNVYSRFSSIAKTTKATTIIRITGDNPFLDHTVLDEAIIKHHTAKVDYSITTGLPTGMNVEIIEGRAFERISEDLLSESELEHVTSQFRNSTEFTSQKIEFFPNESLSNLRLTVDYVQDYALASLLFSKWSISKNQSYINFIRSTFENEPWLFEINKENYQVKQFKSKNEEYKYSAELLSKMQLKESAKLIQNSIINN